MIVDYDKRPQATTDEKIRSLIENLMLSFAEIETQLNEQRKALNEIRKMIERSGS